MEDEKNFASPMPSISQPDKMRSLKDVLSVGTMVGGV